MRPVLLSLLVSLVVFAPTGAHGSHVDPGSVVYALPPDRIPAITEASFSATDWLTREHGGDEKVVAVVIDGDARAYPLRILAWHEIVNDVVGGTPIAATYCPLCGTGVTWDRTLDDGTVLTFKVSGSLYKNDLVMYDVRSGPDSWWPQVLGEAITGPHHGGRLRLVSSTVVPWHEFRALFPDARLLARPVDADGAWIRDYSFSPYAGYEASGSVWFPQGHVDPESVLHPKDLVLSVTLDGRAKLYPYRSLSEEPVVNDVVGETPIVVTFALGNAQAFHRGDREFSAMGGSLADNFGLRWDPLTGEGEAPGTNLVAVPAVNAYFFAAFDFAMEATESVDVHGIGTYHDREGGTGSGGFWATAAVPATLLAATLIAFALRHRSRQGGRD